MRGLRLAASCVAYSYPSGWPIPLNCTSSRRVNRCWALTLPGFLRNPPHCLSVQPRGTADGESSFPPSRSGTATLPRDTTTVSHSLANLLLNRRTSHVIQFGLAEGIPPGGTFSLTPNALINTAMTVMHSYPGSVKVRRICRPRFSLRSGVRLAFTEHFRY